MSIFYVKKKLSIRELEEVHERGIFLLADTPT
jgi:hypothetical protein